MKNEEILKIVTDVETYLSEKHPRECYAYGVWEYANRTLSIKDEPHAPSSATYKARAVRHFAELPEFVRRLEKSVREQGIANYAAARALTELMRGTSRG